MYSFYDVCVYYIFIVLVCIIGEDISLVYDSEIFLRLSHIIVESDRFYQAT